MPAAAIRKSPETLIRIRAPTQPPRRPKLLVSGVPRYIAAAQRLAVSCLIIATVVLASPGVVAQDASSLRERHGAMKEPLANNPFGKPLFMDSVIADGTLRSDIYALFDQPFPALSHALNGTDHWCDIMILHLNVKNCTVIEKAGKKVIRVAVGRKHDQALADAFVIEFNFSASQKHSNYLEVQLSAKDGPFSTRDYRIDVESVAIDEKRSFIHLSYSYKYGTAARLAMEAFLATVARNKVGFSIVDRKPDGTPVYVGGSRGLVERNTMRYYLAIEAFLRAFHLPPKEQAEHRLRDWFNATERYPRQLRELPMDEYLTMKRAELTRQAATSAAAASK